MKGILKKLSNLLGALFVIFLKHTHLASKQVQDNKESRNFLGWMLNRWFSADRHFSLYLLSLLLTTKKQSQNSLIILQNWLQNSPKLILYWVFRFGCRFIWCLMVWPSKAHVCIQVAGFFRICQKSKQPLILLTDNTALSSSANCRFWYQRCYLGKILCRHF